MNEKKTATITIRTTPSLKDALTLAAVRERRSISQMIEIFIENGLRAYAEKHSDFTGH